MNITSFSLHFIALKSETWSLQYMMSNFFYLQNTQKGVGVAILTSTDGIKVVSPDGKVVD